MKALIIAADAVTPEIIFGNPSLFPNLHRLIDSGASAAYSAYVQKNFTGSYSSEQNWASIYTGLPPERHQIDRNIVNGESRRPMMKDFEMLQPFWKVLNASNYTVGLWCADCCFPPSEIDGYAVSVQYDYIITPAEIRTAPRKLKTFGDESAIIPYLCGDIPSRIYPKTLSQQGYTFEQLKSNPDLAWEAIESYHFQEIVPSFEHELQYFGSAMINVQNHKAVDVMYFFTPTTDLIAHCCMYCDDNDVLIRAYQALDRFIGDLITAFQPEISIFLSDHGQQNFKDLVRCSDPEIRYEAFGERDNVLWLKNDYIAFKAFNGALLFTAHSLKGTFIASGNGIRHTVVKNMRTLDIYPTLLEMLEVPVPKDRSGFVMEIFNHSLINSKKSLKLIKHMSVALIQAPSVSLSDIFINELYIEKRFSDITLVGEVKYREIFINNPRVAAFVSLEEFDASGFDEVYCCFYNETTKLMRHIKVK